MRGKITLFALCLLLPVESVSASNPLPPSFEYRITGLFCPEREEDLREAVSKLPGVELISIDYKNAAATFSFDPFKLFPKMAPISPVANFDKLLKSASQSTFGVKALPGKEKEGWKLIEIPVLGLDCLGCSLAAYEAIAKIDGVEQATVSFKEGWVRALIDPAKTDRAALETALKKAQVQLPKQ